MDDNKLQTPSTADNQANSDQYQDILDKYTDAMNSKTPQPDPLLIDTDTPLSLNENISNPVDIIPAIEPEPIKNPLDNKAGGTMALSQNIEIDDKEGTFTPPIQKPEAESPYVAPIESPHPSKPVVTQDEESESLKTPEDVKSEIDQLLHEASQQEEVVTLNQDQSPKPSSLNIFKIIFFISLILFVGVSSLLVYNLLIKPNNNKAEVITETTPTTTTFVSDIVCTLNDMKLKANETFEASDGCNTCTCNDDTTISCTEKACEVSITNTVTPTKSATISSVPKDWKTYTDPKLGFSISYPSDYIITPITGLTRFNVVKSDFYSQQYKAIMGDAPSIRIDYENKNIINHPFFKEATNIKKLSDSSYSFDVASKIGKNNCYSFQKESKLFLICNHIQDNDETSGVDSSFKIKNNVSDSDFRILVSSFKFN